jgi:D-alanine transaminase
MTVFLNGEFMPLEEAKIPVLDRGFIFGDGVYEFIPVYSKRPFRLQEHFVRLQNSLDAVRIENPYTLVQWEDLVRRMIDAHPWDDQSLYLHITRGVAKRDHSFPNGMRPTVFMMSGPLVTPSAELVKTGASAIVLEDFRWLRCDIKAISLLGNCMLRTAATEQDCAEAILVRDGYLTEASASNVFIVQRGTVLAPPKSHLILPGITYDVVIELLQANTMPHEIRPISESELRGADEIWLTSSSREVLAVTTLDKNPIGAGKPGPAFSDMHLLYQRYKAEVMRAHGHV